MYGRPFCVETAGERFPEPRPAARPIGGHLEGCRIGFDAGGSDRKVSAVVDGRTVYSEEVIWHPKTAADPRYHQREVLCALRTAAAHLPRVDAIGVSTAGIAAALEKGRVTAIAAVNVFSAGYLAVEAAAKLARHESWTGGSSVGFSIVRQETMYSSDNQKLLFPVT